MNMKIEDKEKLEKKRREIKKCYLLL